ncbi:hypothetical protein KY335_01630 [Candidatus Woesearchaeota archaeon]|nr:hypothetical protein [Candidatus Woesearchaeota archaeon]MBW3013924.1 hypothetical protein [Candidatus Woesearchaeota archaeon]
MVLRRLFGTAVLGLGFLLGCGGPADEAPLEDRVAQAQETAPREQQTAQQTKKEKVDELKLMRFSILSYLANPRFISSDFMKQITGVDARMELLHVGERMVYMSIPGDLDYKDAAKKLSLHPENVDWGQLNDDGNLQIGDYILNRDGVYFMRVPIDEFRIDPEKRVTIDYEGIVSYDISMQELNNFMLNESIYGGLLFVYAMENPTGIPKKFANHGVMVARKGEPSLQRLVKRLLKGCNTNEQKAQRLLDFVNLGIDFDKTANDDGETLKRPNEVLMTKKADCSGKSILLASLYEQTGLDYFFLYTQDHITVAVAGDFEDENGLSFTFKGKNYFIAESAVGDLSGRRIRKTRFVIGRSRLGGDPTENKIGYQIPGEDAKVYNIETGQAYPMKLSEVADKYKEYR